MWTVALCTTIHEKPARLYYGWCIGQHGGIAGLPLWRSRSRDTRVPTTSTPFLTGLSQSPLKIRTTADITAIKAIDLAVSIVVSMRIPSCVRNETFEALTVNASLTRNDTEGALCCKKNCKLQKKNRKSHKPKYHDTAKWRSRDCFFSKKCYHGRALVRKLPVLLS